MSRPKVLLASVVLSLVVLAAFAAEQARHEQRIIDVNTWRTTS